MAYAGWSTAANKYMTASYAYFTGFLGGVHTEEFEDFKIELTGTKPFPLFTLRATVSEIRYVSNWVSATYNVAFAETNADIKPAKKSALIDITTNPLKDPCAYALVQKKDTKYINGYTKTLYHNEIDKTGTTSEKILVTDLFT